MNKSHLLGTASVMTLAACTNMAVDGGANLTATTPLDNFCNSQYVDCIDVSVSGGAINKINDLSVGEPNHVILWRMSPLTSSWSFPGNGITFKGSPQPQSNEISCKVGAGGKLFFCVDRNTIHATYSYTVTLKDSAGNTITLDPKIVNN